MLELVVYYKKWGNIMDNEICDFLKIIQLKEILIVTEKDSAIKDLTKKTNYNITFIESTGNSTIISDNREIFKKEYDLIILDDECNLLDNVLEVLNELSADIPLIILKKSYIPENIENTVSTYNLEISPISEKRFIIYEFKKIDKLLDNSQNCSPQIAKCLDNIYKLNYLTHNKSSMFYPINIFLNSNRIGGIKHLPTYFKGYDALSEEDNLDIGYYLRRNNIKDCNDVKLHFILNALENSYFYVKSI